ncbi:MAG: hypothetical protein H8E66_04020 [Planctomycetes bacterium]|nr:hypothetical protein [Planctomycetota bacterium]
MAFVLCDKHGGHVAPLVCPHLQDDVINQRPIASVIRVDAEYLGEPAWSVQLCPACATEHRISESTLLPGDDGLDAVFEFDQQSVCQFCFNELPGLVDAVE